MPTNKRLRLQLEKCEKLPLKWLEKCEKFTIFANIEPLQKMRSLLIIKPNQDSY